MSPTVCPVCGGVLRPFTTRASVPVHQHVLLRDAEEARATPRGTLALDWCAGCGLVTNVAFNESLLSYGGRYDNSQTFSPAFSDHVAGLVESLLGRGVRGKQVLEIGCGKGAFLREICSRGANDGIGFDPSYVGPDSDLDGRARFERQLFHPRLVASPADVVVCRHVIEHVRSPVQLLSSAREVLRDGGLLFLETPALEWILSGVVFWDLFYEHCGYFTKTALANAAQAAGFEILELRPVFGAQYLAVTARAVDRPPPLQPPAADFAQQLERYRQEEESRLETWDRRIAEFAQQGPLAVWGAGAKGATFVNLLDPDASRIACLVDINPAKQQHYLAGTGHKVISPVDLRGAPIRSVLVMNPNYLTETLELARNLGLQAEFHTT